MERKASGWLPNSIRTASCACIAKLRETSPKRWINARHPPLQLTLLGAECCAEDKGALSWDAAAFSVRSQSLNASAATDHPVDQSSKRMLPMLSQRFIGRQDPRRRSAIQIVYERDWSQI